MKYIFFLKQFLIVAIVLSGNNIFAQLSPLAIGTIPKNDSVIVVYRVTINNPFNNVPSEVSNQGTISGNNFANVLTNDPETITPNDSTKTLVSSTNPSLITDYFRSKQTGNWNNVNTWESSQDNINWHPATLTPDFNASTITVVNPHTITVTANVTINQFIISPGSSVVIATGVVFTIN